MLPGTTIIGQVGAVYTASIDPNATGGTAISSLQTIDYAYHIRGMLRGINLDAANNPNPNTTQGDLFAYKLDYETAGYWDGNIGKETWKSSRNAGQARSYTYNYDKASRLLSAVYAGGQYNAENYSLSNISYDKNGNMKTFSRNGMTAQSGINPTAFGFIDVLDYQYTGNRLNGIKDFASNTLDVSDLRDNGNYTDYTYHQNGSLNSDANRGINAMAWDDFLSKPKEINYSDGRWVKHFYDGSGKKMKTTDSDNTVWEYFDGLILKNNTAYQLNFDEGRSVIDPTTSSWQQEFEYQDHLGNARVGFRAISTQLTLSQENSYYPFGMSHTGLDYTLGANTNNFLYNGKEKINSFGLNYSDYGFRNYDFLSNRFISSDPLAHKFPELTNYQYASNNPVLNIDLDGLEGVSSANIDWSKVKNPTGINTPTYRLEKNENSMLEFTGKITYGGLGFEGKFLGLEMAIYRADEEISVLGIHENKLALGGTEYNSEISNNSIKIDAGESVERTILKGGAGIGSLGFELEKVGSGKNQQSIEKFSATVFPAFEGELTKSSSGKATADIKIGVSAKASLGIGFEASINFIPTRTDRHILRNNFTPGYAPTDNLRINRPMILNTLIKK